MGTYHRGDRIRLWGTFWVNQTTLALEAPAAVSTITVRDVTGYANAEPLVLGPGTPEEEFAVVSGTPTAAGVITLTAPLRYRHGVNTVIGELTTPSTHTVRTKNPAGTEADQTTSVFSAGRVFVDLTIPNLKASEGTWTYVPTGSAGVLATDEQTFVCAASAMA